MKRLFEYADLPREIREEFESGEDPFKYNPRTIVTIPGSSFNEPASAYRLLSTAIIGTFLNRMNTSQVYSLDHLIRELFPKLDEKWKSKFAKDHIRGAYNPTVIDIPNPEDYNPKHRAFYYFIRYVILRIGSPRIDNMSYPLFQFTSDFENMFVSGEIKKENYDNTLNHIMVSRRCMTDIEIEKYHYFYLDSLDDHKKRWWKPDGWCRSDGFWKLFKMFLTKVPVKQLKISVGQLGIIIAILGLLLTYLQVAPIYGWATFKVVATQIK
jgi:hypothetical protein